MNGLKLVLPACALLLAIGCWPAADLPARQPAEGGEIVFVSTLNDPSCAYFDGRAKEFLVLLDAGAIIDGIVRDVVSFASGAEQADNITFLAFKFAGRDLDGSGLQAKLDV